MTHLLERKVGSVVRGYRRWMWLYALSRLVTATVLVLLVAGAADYLLRLQATGSRILLSAGVLLVVGYVFSRRVLPALRRRRSWLEVAVRIEQFFPELTGKLSSALAFLRSPDSPVAGSSELRHGVVREAARLVEPLDLVRCLDRRPSLRALSLAALVLIAAVGLCAWDLPSAACAAHRLFVPWAGPGWPRNHHLAFVDAPAALAAGQDFVAQVVDLNGRLPEHVQIDYWLDGDSPHQIVSRDMQRRQDRMLDRWVAVPRGLRYRAVGGDDNTMAWQRLEIVEPPQVEVDNIRIQPPAYTHWPATSSGPVLYALEGSQVAWQGRTNVPVIGVRLQTDTASTETEVPVELAGNGTVLAVHPQDWTLARSGEYRFMFVDAQEISSQGRDKWSITVVPDHPPTITLDTESLDTLVVPQARLLVRAVVDDDVAIAAVDLRYRRSDRDSAKEQVISLYTGAPPPAPESLASLPADERRIDYVWNLADVPNLVAGASLDLRLVARDIKGQTSETLTVHVAVTAPEQLVQRWARQHAAIAGQLEEILDHQREAHSQTQAAQETAVGQPQAMSSQRERLQTAEMQQRQVARGLGDAHEGLEHQVLQLLDERERNQLATPDVVQRLEHLLTEARRLRDEVLPHIEQPLTQAAKTLNEIDPGASPESRAATVRSWLDDAVAHQAEAIQRLEQLQDEFAEWEAYRRFAAEVQRLRDRQTEVWQESRKERPKTLAKDPSELEPGERGVLQRLADEQRDLANQLDRLQARMAQLPARLQERDPQSAASLRRAVETAQQRGVSGQMRTTGTELENNRLGEATQQQQQIVHDLSELQDILAGSSTAETAAATADRKRIETELLELEQQQAELHQTTITWNERRPPGQAAWDVEAAQQIRGLGSRQLGLADSAREWATHPRGVRVLPLAARGIESAMRAAAQRLDTLDPGAATQASQQRALELLRAVRAAIASPLQASAKPGAAPRQKPAAGSPGALSLTELKLVNELQSDLYRRTQELESRRAKPAGWTAADAEEAARLAEEQGELAQLVAGLAQAPKRTGAEEPRE